MPQACAAVGLCSSSIGLLQAYIAPNRGTKLFRLRQLIFLFMGMRLVGPLPWRRTPRGGSESELVDCVDWMLHLELEIALSGVAAKVQPLGKLARPKMR